MDWPVGVIGRILAAVYLVAFPATYAGVVWTFIDQWRGDDMTLNGATILFLAGALLIMALSVVLRHRVPERPNRLTKGMSGDQRAYHRLALGLELARAWRALTN
jgi:RsiW-degrading membrane proteinase PrsW (M82 family)